MNPLRSFCVIYALAIIGLTAQAALAQNPPAATPPPAPPATPGLPTPATVHSGILVINPETGNRIAADSLSLDGNTFTGMDTVTLYVNQNKVKAAYLGLYISPADATLQSQLGLPDGVGIVISGMDDSGPAKKAGCQDHDVIYKVGDQIAINPAQFQVLIRMHKPGDSLELTLYRHAQEMKVTATLVEKEVPALDSSGDATPTWALQRSAAQQPFFKLSAPRDNQN